MPKVKKESYFWTSYSDMMTSLFFIMLVLFVLAIGLLAHRLVITQDVLDNAKKAQESTEELNNNGDFEYDKKYKKYVLKVKVFFPETQSDFKYLSPEALNSLDRVGNELVDFFKRHRDNDYLLIVEGQASRNSEKQMDDNYEYSFLRAKNLMKFWLLDKHKNFGSNCEVQIAGSGDGRLNVNILSANNNPYDKANQRFLIYIIPKNIFEETDSIQNK
jgi:hypothetical protein